MSVNQIATYIFNSVSFPKCIASFTKHITTCFKYYSRKSFILLNRLFFLINQFNFNIQNLHLIQTIFYRQSTYERKKKLLNLLSRNTLKNLCECEVLILFKPKFSSLTKVDYNLKTIMTITDVRFIEIREDHPSLDAEIRGILLSRAQYGSTISDIESDYLKLMGTSFPVKENITEFLLTVPHVMVYCDENGKRLFNIMPQDKTKHLLELVLHQNPIQQQQQTQRQRWQQSSNYADKINSYNSNNNLCNNLPHYNKRYRSNETLYSYLNIDNNFLHQQPLQQYEQSHQQQSIDTTKSCCKMLQSYNNNTNAYQYNHKENTCFYQDNCNYFYNRFYNNHLLRNPEQSSIQTNSQYLPNNQKLAGDVPCNGSYAFQDPNIKINYYQHHRHNAYNDNDHHINNQEIKSKITATTNRDPLNHRYNIHSSSPTDNYTAQLFDFLLLGDDFLLYMARMELGCKFKKDERILQSGLCVSGQNISAAMKRLQHFNIYNRSIIMNIGSVDIMKGRALIEIQHDFRELLTTVLKRNAKPILTTLAPLANYAHDKNIKKVLLRYNEFIKREAERNQLIVVDIFTCLVNAKGHTLFDCYQNEPRPVTGTTEPYLFWNKIGRQRVLRLIESYLEY